MSAFDLLDTVAGRIVTYTAALTAIVWLLGKSWKAFRRIDRIDRVLRWVETEMKPNGGSSLRDAVNRLERGQQEHSGELAAVRQELGEHKAEHARQVTVNVNHPGTPAGVQLP